MKILYKCKKCNCDVNVSYGSGMFCSAKCARSYSTANDTKETKILPCKHCGVDVIVDKRTAPTKCVCDKCKQNKMHDCTCVRCGLSFASKTKKTQCDSWECKSLVLPTLIRYFGFNEATVGTSLYHKEFHRIRELLNELYTDNEMATTQIAEIFNHPKASNLGSVLKSLRIETRSFSEARQNSLLHNRSQLPASPKFKSGWHTTWEGSAIFYRSSYELNYATKLDEMKISYQVESLRISYWDSQLMQNRIAIPDFYLPATNTIVEIKSEYTLDVQNMLDKIQQYKAHGHNFILMVDGVERIL